MAVQSGERRHLICHPATPAKAVRAVWAEVALSFEDGFSLRFGVEGDIGALVLPPCEGQLVIADTATCPAMVSAHALKIPSAIRIRSAAACFSIVSAGGAQQ